MENSRIHLLCTGDLHLGRYPSRIPPSDQGERLSPTFIWHIIVEKALRDEVDVVVIAGDVVDEKNRYYEAFGPFEAGVKELGEKGIDVITVGGNHDYNTMFHLAEQIDSPYFSCLGKDGHWEKKTIKRGETPILNIMGWSYPTRLVRHNPLDMFKPPPGDLPALGLLHAELDNSSSSYAPTASSQLQGTGLVGWVLGHIHKPHIVREIPPFILYPGSPQPLDPGDLGVHGVWDLFIGSSQNVELKKQPLATLEYANVCLDLSGLKRMEELPAFLSRRIREDLEIREESSPNREIFICRVALEGRTELYHQIDGELDRLKEELRLTGEGSTVIIDKLVNRTRPSVDLKALSQGSSPVSLLAQLLLNLEQGLKDNRSEDLVRRVEAALLSAYRSNAYSPLRVQSWVDLPGREEALAILKQKAWLLLDTLLAQKEGGI